MPIVCLQYWVSLCVCVWFHPLFGVLPAFSNTLSCFEETTYILCIYYTDAFNEFTTLIGLGRIIWYSYRWCSSIDWKWSYNLLWHVIPPWNIHILYTYMSLVEKTWRNTREMTQIWLGLSIGKVLGDFSPVSKNMETTWASAGLDVKWVFVECSIDCMHIVKYKRVR